MHLHSTAQHSFDEVRVAGRLSSFAHVWHNFTSDAYILNAVLGYKIEFVDNVIPLQHMLPFSVRFAPQEEIAIDDTIQSLIAKGVIVATVHEPGEFINSIFVRPKKDSGLFRMILNLKPLNKYVAYHKFKMDTLRSVTKLVRKNCFMASLDIKDAYYTVKIHQIHEKLLKFHWKGTLYKYTCLPNGLASAPRLFTKLLKPLLAALRLEGYIVAAYIDDCLCLADSAVESEKAVSRMKQVLEQCGFLIHDESKSVLTGVHEIEFLGFIINSTKMTLTLTDRKKEKYVGICNNLCQKSQVTIRELAQVIGNLVSTFDGVKYGQLFYRNLEQQKIKALRINRGNFEASVTVTASMKQELKWWIDNLPTSFNDITVKDPELVLYADATLEAWGAFCDGSRLGGFFSIQERQYTAGNINACEILAIKLALEAIEHLALGKHICVRSDNTTAVAYRTFRWYQIDDMQQHY